MSMRRIITAMTGALQGETFALDKRTILGRSGDVDIQVLDDEISREHVCLMENDYGHMMCIDMSSRNGTFVNDNKTPRHRLRPGDIIRIGAVQFVYDEVARGAVSDSDSDIKVMTGPARKETELDIEGKVAVGALAREVQRHKRTVVACTDPLHAQALDNGWKHCPACGGPVG